MYRKTMIFSAVFIISQFAFHSIADSPEIGKEHTPPGTNGSVMVVVPAGEFMMGVNPATDDRYGDWDDEKPFQKLYLDEFYIDKYEATVDDYNQCIRARKCKKPTRVDNPKIRERCNWFNKGRGKHPITYISWSEAKTFCEWAGKRLPTEAEWEKAARGTDGRQFPWGSGEATCEHAVFHEANTMSSADWGCKKGISWPVGSKPKGASPYGAMDMAGNASEWVADWYFEDYYRRAPRRNPKGPDSGEAHFTRGGGFNDYKYGIRTTRREAFPMGYFFPGVRCALTP